MWETWVRSLGQEDPLEKAMATRSSTLAWKIPWMEEPGGLSPPDHKELHRTEQVHFSGLKTDGGQLSWNYTQATSFTVDLFLLCTTISPNFAKTPGILLLSDFFFLNTMLFMFWESFPFNFSLINNNYLGIIMSSAGSFAHRYVLYSTYFLWS